MPQTMESIYSPAVLKRGRKLIEDERIHRSTNENRFVVRGSEEYTVAVVPQPTDEDGEPVKTDLPWVVCSCPNGMARGGRPNCYHSAAVLLMLLDEVDEQLARIDPDGLDPKLVERSSMALLIEHGFSGDPRVAGASEVDQRVAEAYAYSRRTGHQIELDEQGYSRRAQAASLAEGARLEEEVARLGVAHYVDGELVRTEYPAPSDLGTSIGPGHGVGFSQPD